MTTVRYSRYVLVDESRGSIVWYESEKSALRDQQKNGGELFDTETTDPEDLEIILHHVRHGIGLE
jgi:hypothetical protein